jgi:hypothetical protein
VTGGILYGVEVISYVTNVAFVTKPRDGLEE